MCCRRAHGKGAGLSSLSYLSSLYRSAPRKVWLLRAGFWPYRRARTVVSADGTRLSARRSGRGVPVVLVHGSLSSKDNALIMTEAALSDEFLVWCYDRRGRGRSGDGQDYSLDREVDDLLAVLDVAGSPAHVVAHSFGAIVALLAAQAAPAAVRSLTLYEPPLNQRGRDENAVQQVRADVAANELDRAVRRFYTIAGVTDDEVAILRSVPKLWRQLQDACRAAPRELAAIEGCHWDPDRWKIDGVPVLLVTGGDTDDPVFPSVDDLRVAFPDAETAVIPGQRHLAAGFAPWVFTEEIRRFITRF